MRFRIVWSLATLSAVPVNAALSQVDEATKGRISFYRDCWTVELTASSYREAAVKKRAADKLEEPDPKELAKARRDGVDVFVSANSVMKCANIPAPEKLVVENAAGTRTPIPLETVRAVRRNAFNAEGAFDDGVGFIPGPKVRPLLAGGAKIYLVFQAGPPSSWDIPGEKLAYLWDDNAQEADAAATVKRVSNASLAAAREQFALACPASGAGVRLASLGRIADARAELASRAPTELPAFNAIVAENDACLLGVLHERRPDVGVVLAVTRLLVKTDRSRYEAALARACAEADRSVRQDICATAGLPFRD